jgi:preprotein translocase subunit SecF
MDIDKFNIYRNNGYWIVTAIALILLIVAIFNIPHIRKGVEFTGGILAIADINHSVDVEALKMDLGVPSFFGEPEVDVLRLYS